MVELNNNKRKYRLIYGWMYISRMEAPLVDHIIILNHRFADQRTDKWDPMESNCNGNEMEAIWIQISLDQK